MPSGVRTTISSAFLMVESRWATTRVVRPWDSSPSDSWIRCSVALSRAEVASSRTVSYTHLDVYKRQVFVPWVLCDVVFLGEKRPHAAHL